MAVEPTVAESSQLLQIPDELLDNICLHCTTEDLMTLRTVSSKFERFAASRLFRTFTLYPHTISFRNLSSVAKSSRIHHHVQTLFYDAKWRGTVAMVLAFLAKERDAEPQSVETREVFAQHMREMDSQALQADNVSHQLTQMGVLEDIFESLVGLKHIVADEGTWARIGELSRQDSLVPQFYQRLVRGYEVYLGPLNLADSADDGYSPRHYPCALNLLAAARKLPGKLESFRINNTDWHACFDELHMFKYPDVYAPSLEWVKTAEFSLAPQQCKYIRSWTIVENVQDMLRLMINLESLRLVLRNDEQGLPARSKSARIYDGNHRLFVKSFFQLSGSMRHAPLSTPARLTWSSKVTHLTVQGLVCTLLELQSVLLHCANSLKELKLPSLIVLPETSDGPRACLVKMIKWMESHLHLDQVDFEEYLTNCGTQNWFVNRDTEGSCLYNQVTRFITRGGPCPLDHVEIPEGYFDLGKQDHSEDIPWMLKDESCFGDVTWDMRVSDLEFELPVSTGIQDETNEEPMDVEETEDPDDSDMDIEA